MQGPHPKPGLEAEKRRGSHRTFEENSEGSAEDISKVIRKDHMSHKENILARAQVILREEVVNLYENLPFASHLLLSLRKTL